MNLPCCGTGKASASASAVCRRFFAHIRKDGANFATIDCYSNDNGWFVVKKFMPSLLARPDWQVRFDKDINTIPLLELLAGLPI